WVDHQINTPQTIHELAVKQLYDDRGLSSSEGGIKVSDAEKARLDVWWETAVTAPDQLRQRVAFALSQIMVVSTQNSRLKRAARGIANYQDTLALHGLGNYRNLIEAVTLHPVMGDYLSMRTNQKENFDSKIRPDENYARELMQLFSLGLYELNLDGSIKQDNQGQPIPTYTQDDIYALARVFTGWNYHDATKISSNRRTDISYLKPMTVFESAHDTDKKALLNRAVLPAGQTAKEDLNDALDTLFHHPNVGPFIAQRLLERLVTSNPSPEYVKRVAQVFNDNGDGIRGDMAAVIKAILLDKSAFDQHKKLPAYSGKLKEPILRLTQLWRAFDAKGVNGIYRLSIPDKYFSQKPFSAPSVFNFYQPTFAPNSTFSDLGLVAPEFQILTEANIVNTTNRFYGYARSDDINSPGGSLHQIILNVDAEKKLASNPKQLIDHLNTLLMGGLMSDVMQHILIDYLSTIEQGDGTDRVNEALALIITSPEYAVQR
ncbi:MAG: DUF1800 domain-containing protein, partial [Cellvibrionales bacterium]|nr:DUF1800 domain-containing protein [Cellvibrionales bacterium]